MALSSKKPIMRRQKGWIGFVRSYKHYIEHGYYDHINWTGGTKKPKSVTKDVMGKQIIKF